MNQIVITRIKEEAIYLIKTEKTIREVAKDFKISKSTLHKDMQKRLKDISPQLNEKVQKILKKHKKERHIKGGIATKALYAQKEKENEKKRIYNQCL